MPTAAAFVYRKAHCVGRALLASRREQRLRARCADGRSPRAGKPAQAADAIRSPATAITATCRRVPDRARDRCATPWQAAWRRRDDPARMSRHRSGDRDGNLRGYRTFAPTRPAPALAPYAVTNVPWAVRGQAGGRKSRLSKPRLAHSRRSSSTASASEPRASIAAAPHNGPRAPRCRQTLRSRQQTMSPPVPRDARLPLRLRLACEPQARRAVRRTDICPRSPGLRGSI